MKPGAVLLAAALALATTDAFAAGPQTVRMPHRAATSPAADPSPGAGIRTVPVVVPERGGTMEMTLWYPAGTGGDLALIGDSPLFRGEAVRRGAPILAGPWPLIILSQGGLRSGPNIGAWMASRLAARGFVVALLRQADPTHLTEAQTLPEIWLRPADISAALTAVLADTALADRIDTGRIGVLGYQIGGTAALALAGGRLDAAKVQASCDAGGVGVDCARFRKAGLDLRTVDPGLLGRSNDDPRVTSIVVVDPEFSRDFTPESLAGISIPVQIFNLGEPGTAWPGLDGSDLPRHIPGARYDRLPAATQYDAFPECKPQAAAILREDGEEPLCDSTGGHSRAEIHDQLATMVQAALRFGRPRPAHPAGPGN